MPGERNVTFLDPAVLAHAFPDRIEGEAARSAITTMRTATISRQQNRSKRPADLVGKCTSLTGRYSFTT
jgi:hypothetical protein